MIHAQNAHPENRLQDTERCQVEWLGMIPDPGAEKTEGFLSRLSEILLGAEPDKVKKPFALAAESPDKIWFLDQETRSLMHYREGEITIPAGFKKSGLVFPSLVDLCFLPEGDILFTDSRNNKVYIYHKLTKQIGELNPGLTFDKPTGIAYSEVTGEIWLVETGAHCLTRLSPGGDSIKKLGHRGTLPGEFNFPTSIWIDQEGLVYVVDAMNFRIQIFDRNGQFITAFGEAGNASGYFARPKGIATDSFGNIYVVDALYHSVQIFNREGELLDYFGDQGQGRGQFWMPAGIYIDKENYIYVADSYNSRIQIYQTLKSAKE